MILPNAKKREGKHLMKPNNEKELFEEPTKQIKRHWMVVNGRIQNKCLKVLSQKSKCLQNNRCSL